MAQAARLNLRLQKELKLLLTDPPPGASFPFLSAHSDLTSLSTIHAQIEGPEGTVYAKGVFDIKIQIPERYPFQPPSVTFATPIYHPNIDNGGRICLDILNLPPKGAWQPSLNISTILTSIGLLLSEPNPDDGLMCEASREYKYNRQAFDQKARSMTEKHAKAGASWNNCDAKSGLQKNLNSSVAEFRGSESRLEVSELASSHNNPCAISRKLSLEFSSSSQNRDSDVEANEMGSNGKRKELNINIDDRNLRHEKLCRTRGKLSLESSCQIQKRDDHDKENVVSNHSLLCIPDTVSATSSGSSSLQPSSFCQKNSELKNVSIKMSSKQPWQLNQEKQLGSYPKASCGAPSMSLSSSCNEQEHPNDSISSMGNGSSEVNFKKVPPFCKGSSQAEEKDNKENMLPIWRQTLSSAQRSSTTSRIGRKLSLGSVTQSQASNENNSQILSLNNNLSDASTSLPLKIEKKEPSDQDYVEKATVVAQPLKTAESPLSEAVVVLDSEDSEEERDGILRSKLMLRRKRIGKCRARA